MNCARPISETRRIRDGFTLAETLAALLFLAIVIPTVVEALHLAGRAGAMAERRAVAARIAERVLNESIVFTNQVSGNRSGVVSEGNHDYSWTVTRQNWLTTPLPLLTAEVQFTIQGQPSSVQLSTVGTQSP
jgi:type II secretory pathway component PulJ